MADLSGLSALLDWRQMLSAFAIYISLSFLFVFTGFLTAKKHSKLSLLFIILLTALGITVLLKYTGFFNYAFASAILIYCAIAVWAWITNNKILKIIRMILAGLIAAFTLYITFCFFIGLMNAIAYSIK